MRTNEHWKQCETQAAHHAAYNLAFQLKEIAKNEGFDPNGIKVLTKKDIFYETNYRADAQVSWFEGPDNWARNIEFIDLPGVCVEPHGSATLSFFNI